MPVHRSRGTATSSTRPTETGSTTGGGQYRNPSKSHIGGKKSKNWDSDLRISDLESDGVVAEVIFPNTVPPFYDTAFHISLPPKQDRYELALQGTRAHNRWLSEFCAEAPERRAGIGLIQLHDLDDTLEDITFIAENGLTGGVIVPLPSPSDTDLVINQHAGQGTPFYADAQGSKVLWAMEMSFFVQRGFTQLIMGGVFERFPGLRFILTESGCAWVPKLLQQMDGMHMAAQAGAIGEIDTAAAATLSEPPSHYAKTNCWYGASFPSPAELRGADIVGVDHLLWGNDYPHYEGCYPYSRENMQFALSDTSEADVRMILGENAADLYGFDLDALRPHAERINITPEQVSTPLAKIPADSTCITFQRARFEQAAR